MDTKIALSAVVTDDMSGKRLDQIAAKLFPDYSRARLQSWIIAGSLRVDDQCKRSRDKVAAGAILSLDAVLSAEEEWCAESMELDIVFEDDSLLVINKPAGSVVHPAAGHRDGTLLNGLLHHCPQLQFLPRAGIVHRLDKDTTGLMVVAKTLPAHTSLVQQLQAREVSREYEAVVNGILTGGGVIRQPIGRHPVNRKKQAVINSGKEAITHFTVIQRFKSHTHVRVRLETGRTHQIRVHFTHLRYPLVGDRTYGGRLQIPAGCSQAVEQTLRQFGRQALHARKLGLIHPESGELMAWESELPADLQALLAALSQDLKE